MKAREIYPLTFEPVFRDYIWGGRNLETRFGRTLPPGIVAESWDISGHPSSPTRVDYGPLAGATLPEVQARLGTQLVGTRSRWATDRHKFPLLVKLLDANRPLSVQVHPPDEYALEYENGELGKTEMWYVLYAQPGAQLVYGLSKKTSAAAFRSALQDGKLDEYLHYLPIKQGDAILIPTGTIHALLEGTVVAEIQQNSDTTYRVYDWGRIGTDGKSRPLHIDKALEVIDFDMIRPQAYEPAVVQDSDGIRRAEISRCPYFVVEKVELDSDTAYQGQCDGSTFEIWGCIKGQAKVQWAGDPAILPAVRFALLPAALCAFSIYTEQPATLLRAFAPQ
jgi:mannose-6-phosphate isomerase